MEAKNIQAGNCYKYCDKHGIRLFKVEFFEIRSGDIVYEEHLIITTKKAIVVRNHTISSEVPYIHLSPTDTVEQIDELLIDKTIKQFNMSKAAILATINQDKANEAQRDTTQGDYQLP